MPNNINSSLRWRVSSDGFSIKSGWADDKKIIAKYPGVTPPFDEHVYQEWIHNAEKICDLYNLELERII